MARSKAVVVTGPGHIEMREYDLPETGAEDGLLKVELVGVCGSDPKIFQGKPSRGARPFPLILGHEIVGRVHKMGEAARKRHGVGEGDRVIVEYAFGCGQCRPCLSGRYTLCDKMYSYGSMISCQDPPHLFGAYSQYLYIHPRALVHRIGDGVSPELGVLVGAVFGNAVRWMSRIGNATVGRSVAIVGPGPIGLAAVAVAKECGAEPIIVMGLDRDKSRLEMAGRFGADVVVNVDREDAQEAVRQATRDRMADLIMDVSGHPSGAALALSVAGIGATMVLPGLYGASNSVGLLLDTVVVKELKLLGAYSQDFESVEAAIKLVSRGKYPLEEMISHRLPLEEAERALRLVGGESEGEVPLKVVLDPWM
jgi:alcohol dehydrogenase